MDVIETRTFRSGDGVAVRLPLGLGLPAGTPVILEQVGDTVTVRPATVPVEAEAKLDRMIARLETIWQETSRPVRAPEGERILFPERPHPWRCTCSTPPRRSTCAMESARLHAGLPGCRAYRRCR